MDERVFIAYDMADNRQRSQVCKALERYGVRVQYSLFELSLALKDLHKLVDHLKGLIDNTHDRLLVVRLCPRCHDTVDRYGNVTAYEPEHTLIF